MPITTVAEGGTMAAAALATGDEVPTVRLAGPVTLYESAEVRATLLAALEEAEGALRIDLESSGPWDLAGLQLLVSAVATGRQRGGAVQVVQVPGVCRELAERAGLAGWLDGVCGSFV